LIAISVMFVLLVGAVFAQPTLGGNLKMGLPLLKGTFGGSGVDAGPLTFYDAHLNANFGDAKAGGMMRIFHKTTAIDWTPDAFVFLYFRPIDMIRVQVGHNPDGDWGFAQISGWGFNAEAQGGTALDEHRNLSGVNIVGRVKGWYPGFNSRGAAISVFPIPGLTINVGIPFATGMGGTYLSSTINAQFAIPDIGTARAAVTLRGTDSDDKLNTPHFFGSFFLTAIEGMAVDVGVAYRDNFEVGVGFRLNAEDLNIKVRAGLEFGDEVLVGVHVLPSYKIGDVTFLLNAGIGIGKDKFG